MKKQYEILPGETKAEAIYRLYIETPLQPVEIARVVGCAKNYVHVCLWRRDNPGYGANWMRRKRDLDPNYYVRELERQRRKREGDQHGAA
jgi:hypothetical protein